MKTPPAYSAATKIQSGFTLIELMVALAVLGILLTVGLPSFQTMIVQQRLSSATNEVLSGIALTRSEAVKRNSNMRFCIRSSDPIWQLRDFAATPNVIREGTLTTGVTFTVSGLGSTPVSGFECIDYKSEGLPYVSSGLLTNGLITLTNGSQSKAVHIKVGSIYVQ